MFAVPTAEGTNHRTAKDYRPISLSLFLLKTLVRLAHEPVYVYLSIAQQLLQGTICIPKGKSVETAAYDIVGTKEGRQEYILVIFLNIEGDFNNVYKTSMLYGLRDTEADKKFRIDGEYVS